MLRSIANDPESAVFDIFEGPVSIKHSVICIVLSLMSTPEVLVLKNLIQRTSQRVKWTSGARDMNNYLNYIIA